MNKKFKNKYQRYDKKTNSKITPFQFDLNTKGIYKEKYWLGVSYRYSNAIVALAGLNYKNLSFGYAYDYTMTDINAYSSGGHEFFLALKVHKKKEVSSKKFD